MSEPSTTVALYARVSSDEQAERGTIESQLTLLRSIATAHEYTIAGEYLDDGVSGTVLLTNRPGGQRLMRDAKDRRFTMVLVYRVDRLGRSLTALLQAHDLLS